MTSLDGLPRAPPHLTQAPPSAHRTAPEPTLDVLHAEAPALSPHRLPRCPGRGPTLVPGPLSSSEPSPAQPSFSTLRCDPPGPPLKAPPPRCPAPCRLCPLASGVPETVLGTWAPTLPRHRPPSRTHLRQGGHPIHPSHAPPLEEAEPQGAAQVFLFCGLLTDHAPGSHRQPGGRECKLGGEDDLSGRIIQRRSPARHLAGASKYWWEKRAISQPGGRSGGSGGGRGGGAEWDESLPTRKDEEDRPLTGAGLAHTAFPQGAHCRGHVVIAAAELGAPALAGLILLGLGPVGTGDLGRGPRIGKLDGGLALGGRTPGCRGEGGRKREGQNCDPIEQNPSPGDQTPEKVGRTPSPGLSRKPVPSRGRARPASFRDLPPQGQSCREPSSQQH